MLCLLPLKTPDLLIFFLYPFFFPGIYSQNQVDPFLAINDDLQVCVKPQANVRDYGSASDNQAAMSMLTDLRNKIYGSDKVIMNILIQSLSSIITEVCHWIVGEIALA